MRFFVIFLLFINTSHLVKSSVQLPPKMLQADLSAISKYHTKFDNTMEAVLHWPNQVDFYVGRAVFNGEAYVEVSGTFQLPKQSTSYESLFFKDGIFYVKEGDEMTKLSHKDIVHYKQKRFTMESKSYLSIRYKTIVEIAEKAKSFYSAYSEHLNSYSEKVDSIFLATWDGPTEPFVECIMSKVSPVRTVELDQKHFFPTLPDVLDGGVLWLMGKVEKGKLSFNKHGASRQLVFNLKKQVLGIPVDSTPTFLENVYGIRMAEVGYLAEVRGDEVRMLGDDDLDSGNNPQLGQKLLVASFLRNTWRVEPKLCDSKDEDCKQRRPKTALLQVHGHILVKRVNYLDGRENNDCPLVIEYASGSQDFLFGSTPTKQICTDDRKLWPSTSNRNYIVNPYETITLFYPN